MKFYPRGWRLLVVVLMALRLGVAKPLAAATAEYFWDVAPSPGTGMPIPISSSIAWATLSAGTNSEINVAALSQGIHRLGVRFQNDAGQWSEILWSPVEVVDSTTVIADVAQWSRQTPSLALVAAEWFWNSEPAPGAGQAIALTADQAWALNLGSMPSLELDLASLPTGTHQIGLRIRDNRGRWSKTVWASVEIVDPNGLVHAVTQWPIHTGSLTLDAAEWFWKTEPDRGRGQPINLVPAQSWATGTGFAPAVELDLASFPVGVHRLGLRVRDNLGRWSDSAWMQVEMANPAAVYDAVGAWPSDVARTQLVGGEYFWDSDPGSSNGIGLSWSMRAAAVTGSDNIPFIDLDANMLLDGTHRLGYRVRSTNGTWSVTSWIGITSETVDFFPVLISSPGGGVSLNPSKTTFPSNSIVQITATNSPGWSFLRWHGDLWDSKPETYLRVDGPKRIRAVFATPLSVIVSGGSANGAIALNPTNNPVAFGDTTRLMALPAPGKYLVRWDLAGSTVTNLTNPIVAITVTNATPSLTAVFASLPPNHRSLTIRSEGSGSIQRSPALAYYPSNSSVSLTAVPDPGWAFDGWAGDLSGAANPESLSFPTNRSITARFRFTGVTVPPSFASQPADATRIVGQSASFDAVVTGSSPLFFQWFFGSSPIPGATLPSLTLDQLVLTNSGAYSLVVSNSAASVTSRLAQLIVNPTPNIPPGVTWLAPLGSDSFRVPTNIVLLARATDSDGSIQRVDFLLNGAVLGSSSSANPSNTFTFTWTNPPAGTNTLSARAIDNQSASTLSQATDLVVLPPLVTSFSWEFASYSEPERDGILRLKVRKGGNAAGSVFYESVSSGAEPRKDYLPVAATLSFTAEESEKFVEIPLINEFMPDGPKAFEVRLSNPSPGTTLGLIATTVVTLLDDDAALENNSFLGFFPSSARPALPGELQVFTEPAIAGGQWRLPWDARWRNSGDTVTNLDPGPYLTEFRPAQGFSSPAPATPSVITNFRTRSTNAYTADPFQIPGTLRIILSPLAPLESDGSPRWRLVGDTEWLGSGQVRSNLAAGPQVVEFRPVDGWATPGSLSILIQTGTDSSLGIRYSPAGVPPAGATPPASLSSYDAIRNGQQLTQKRTYPMSGQIRTPHGWASGVAVRDRVILTAAHVLFDGSTNLVDPSSIEWFHERHTGAAGYEPRHIRAKGYYFNTNYLAARIAESQLPGWIPGSSTPASQEWDVAALYFDEPVARGGQSGYLLSDAFPNLWLASSREKELAGYPLTSLHDGRLHVTRADNYIFSPVPGTTRVFASSSFFSYAGNSGGPLCVLFDRAPAGSASDPIFFPTAVYLGNYDGLSIVRSIDSMVASLINRAASSAKTGENFLDPGPIRSGPASASPARFGQIRVRLNPPAAVAIGAAWRISSSAPFLPDNSVLTLLAGPLTISFNSVPAFRTPASRELSVIGGLTNEITVAYQPLLPVLPPIADQTIPEGTTFSMRLAATHEASPAPALTFSLLSPPKGLVLTGNLLTWATSEADGPSSHPILVVVSDGITSLTNRFTLTISEINQPPVVSTVPIQFLTNGVPWALQLAASDPDLPPQTLVFSRLAGPPALSVSPSGLAAWTPAEADAGSTNEVRWAVTDSLATVTHTFTAVVAPRSIPAGPATLSGVRLLEDGSLRLSVTGSTGARYVLETSTDLSLWAPLSTNTAPFFFTLPTSHTSGSTFLRAIGR